MEGNFSFLILFFLLIITFLISCIFSIVKIVFSSFVSASSPSDDEYLRYLVGKTETILQNQSLFNNTIAFGRTFSNICFSLLCFLTVASIFPYFYLYQKFLISLVVSLLLLTLLAYDIPRALAKSFFRKLFSPCYYIYKISVWLFFPAVSLSTYLHKMSLKFLEYDEQLFFLSDKEKAIISGKNQLTKSENDLREMIRRILSIPEKSVSEIMVPRIDIRGIELDTPLQAVLQIIRDEGHSRLPVFRKTIDSIVGVLYMKDLLGWISRHQAGEWDIKKILKKPLYVPSSKKVNDLMNDFNSKHIHIAIVVDEYGGTEGIVTMEDILEEIVGDIQDEYDEGEEKEIIRISERSFLVDPHVDIKELGSELGIHLEPENADYTTLSGLIYSKFGDIPTENAAFDYGDLHITILKMNNQRIEKVRIEIIPDSQSTKSDLSQF